MFFKKWQIFKTYKELHVRRSVPSANTGITVVLNIIARQVRDLE